MLRTNQANLLELQIEQLVTTFLGRDLSSVSMFLATYRNFVTTQEVWDLLFSK